MVKWIACPECNGLGSVNEHASDSRRQAVIEAAKEALRFLDGFDELEDAMGLYDSAKDAYSVLRPAVEALEAVSGPAADPD